MGFNSGSAIISGGTVNATIASQGVALTSANATRTTAGSTTVFTVPSGHAYRVYGIILYQEATVSTSAQINTVTLNSVPYLKIVIDHETNVGIGYYVPSILNLGNNYISMSATETAVLTTSGTEDAGVTILYSDITL